MEKKKAILRVESFSMKDGTLLLSASDYGVRSMLGDFLKFLQEEK